MTNNAKIAGAYIRVSTNDQTEYSPESQIKILTDFAKNNSMILKEEFIFRDDGISGRVAEKRPEFMRMIGTAKTNPRPFDVILLWKFSRFARNREDAILYKSMLRKNLGIDVISVSENIGNDKMSILMEAMIEAMDEYYSINLSEEVLRGMTERAKRGGYLSVPPYGYCIFEKRLVVDEDKSKIIKNIFSDFLGGISIHKIALNLNERDIPTARGNNWRTRNIKYILENPIYCGKIRWNNMISKGVHQKIVSEDEFNRSKRILNSRKIRKITCENKDYFLRGMVHCSSCDGILTRVGKGLNCTNYTHGKCSRSHYISMDKVELLVFKVLIQGFDFFENLTKEEKISFIKANVEKIIFDRENSKISVFYY